MYRVAVCQLLFVRRCITMYESAVCNYCTCIINYSTCRGTLYGMSVTLGICVEVHYVNYSMCKCYNVDFVSHEFFHFCIQVP